MGMKALEFAPDLQGAQRPLVRWAEGDAIQGAGSIYATHLTRREEGGLV